MKETIRSILASGADLRARLSSDAAFIECIEKAAVRLRATVKQGGTIFSCGNGGSACDAMHLAEELVARYKSNRPGIRAMHLMDPGTLSCWSNDVGWEDVFARQIRTFCSEKDTLMAISTSGNSKNVLRAIEAARAQKAYVIGMSGKDGGAMSALCDLSLIVPDKLTERIQELHITIIHILCELLEDIHQ